MYNVSLRSLGKEKKAVSSSLDAAIELIGDWQSHPEAKDSTGSIWRSL